MEVGFWIVNARLNIFLDIERVMYISISFISFIHPDPRIHPDFFLELRTCSVKWLAYKKTCSKKGVYFGNAPSSLIMVANEGLGRHFPVA